MGRLIRSPVVGENEEIVFLVLAATVSLGGETVYLCQVVSGCASEQRRQEL